jgi:regulator of protease activity HflC (stomatin/prohibitin superfamily)
VLVMVALVVILVVLVVAGLIAAGRSFKVVQQYERGIVSGSGGCCRGRVAPG